MGKTYPEIDAALAEFLLAQKVFFVASAPSGAAGHVNVSPKGLDSLRLLGPRELAYLDFVGSGAETIAHLRENARLTLMFCAFEGPPRIVRLYGKGTVVEPQDAAFAGLRALFSQEEEGLPSFVRSVIRMSVTRVASSCGYGVPRLAFEGERDQLARWSERKGPEGLLAYQREKNAASIDGLPALRWVEER